jgi:hypothetical protein
MHVSSRSESVMPNIEDVCSALPSLFLIIF